jgi:acetyl-CoA acetyltransferase
MTPYPETPIIIGVADIKNRSTAIADAKEPAQLIHEAILAAILDSSVSDPEKLKESIDSIDVVKTWTWPYPDLPGLLAEKLNVKPAHKFYSDHGGNQPGKLLDEAARRIASGSVKVAVVCGGEALASRELRVHLRHLICITLGSEEEGDINADGEQFLPAQLQRSCPRLAGPHPRKP